METKKWYKSKTIQGGIINLLVMASFIFDLGVEESQITSLIQGVFSVIGTVIVIYGRIVAKTNLEA